MLIQLKDEAGELYRKWLDYYERRGNVTYVERTEAFFKAREGNRPPLFG